ncbi:MAG: gamma-glutamylcyclotransferase family protein [Motiliproteus sp.]
MSSSPEAQDWLYYLAYGSNLHPLRLSQRIPGSRLHGTVVLAEYQLCFHKQGQDGSAKCDLISTKNSLSFGALYRIPATDRPILDEIEGGYQAHTGVVSIAEQELAIYTYLAHVDNINAALEPFDWYLQLVHLGAQYLDFPEQLLQQLTALKQSKDQDRQRADGQQRLLQQMKKFNQHRRPTSLLSGHLVGKFQHVKG